MCYPILFSTFLNKIRLYYMSDMSITVIYHDMSLTVLYTICQGQNYAFLLQLPAGLPKNTILVDQQQLFWPC
jgi:hypothetical protein